MITRLREALVKFVEKNIFEYFILFVIVLSSMLLMLDNPLYDPNGKFVSALWYIDVIISVIFTVEALLKITAYGFLFNGPKSYFRVFWNWLDFIIVIFSVSVSS